MNHLENLVGRRLTSKIYRIKGARIVDVDDMDESLDLHLDAGRTLNVPVIDGAIPDSIAIIHD